MTDERLLQPELAATLAASRQRATPERIALVERAIEALRNSDILSPALRAGDLAPALVLTDAQERPVDVAALWGQAPVIFSFYRGGWCPYCSLELRAWQRLLPEVQSCGATLVAVSPQSPSHSLATIDDNTLAFPVLSDSSIAAAEGFGIAFAMADEQIALYERLGIEIAQRNGNGRWVLPLPTYVIERGGRIAWAHVEVDYRTRAEPADVLAALRELQR
ncbi:MAG: peroxiredoxin-like family protein [Betaproteobacteria bacterium]